MMELMKELRGWQDSKQHLFAAKKCVLAALKRTLTAAEVLQDDGHNLGEEFDVIISLDTLTDELTEINVSIKRIIATIKRIVGGR